MSKKRRPPNPQQIANQFKRALDTARLNVYQRRLQKLAWEIALAGGQILQEDFGFTKEQTAQWLEKTIERAKTNRETEKTESIQ